MLSCKVLTRTVLSVFLLLNGILCAPKRASLPIRHRLQKIRNETLVSVAALAEMIQQGQPNLKVLDGSLSELGYNASEGFKASHIPGAQFFDVNDCMNKTSPFPRMIPTAQEFADYVGLLGISNEDHVIVYDNSPYKIRSSPRVWWMFKVFGHKKVSVLDGGLPKWVEEGFATTNYTDSIIVQNFTATFYPPLLAQFEDMIDNLRTQHYQVVDSRPPNRFYGLFNTTHAVKPGHIPGSINIHFELVLNSDGLIKSTQELMDMFKDGGVDLKRPMIATCRSGILACIHSLVAHLCGVEMPNYDGSWSEYYCRAQADQVNLGPGYAYEDTC